jgi:hypothetical protein
LRKEPSQANLHAGRIAIAELRDRLLKPVQHQKPITIEGRRLAIARMRADPPDGASRQLRDINPSEVQELLSEVGGRRGKSLSNHYVFVGLGEGSGCQGDRRMAGPHGRREIVPRYLHPYFKAACPQHGAPAGRLKSEGWE